MRFALEYLGGLVLALLLVHAALARKIGSPGWVRVEPDQLALVSDFARGRRSVVATPGVRLFVPWFQEVALASRAPGEILFGGDADALPELVVRAKDGTTFSFEFLRVRFALDVSQAARATEEVGLLESDRRALVQALARGVLCDEFGRYTAEEIVVGANLDAARAAARLRLNARLAPHGITVLELPASMPRFDPGYEQQVLRRRVAEQQVELVRAERAKLAGELAQRREKVTREKEVEQAVLVGELASQRTAAGTRALVAVREAEVYALERVEAARNERARLEDRASGLAARYAADAEGFAARVAAVASQGESAVRAAWIDTLGDVAIEIVPYAQARAEGARDPDDEEQRP